ncbi:MAG: hypothetical protein QME81_11305 [bacterium]|nr:hypothetical protein [bacterium]
MSKSTLELKDVYNYINQRVEDNDVKESNLVIRRRRPLWAISNNGKPFSKTEGGFCPIGFTSLAILHDGTVLPCRRLNILNAGIICDFVPSQ